MWSGALAVQFTALGFTLVQAALCAVMVRRSLLVARLGGRSTMTTKMLGFHRGLIVAGCGLTLLRCIDPFAVWGIWPQKFCRVLQTTVTTMILFQLTTLSFIMIDTLYACAMKQTPAFMLYLSLLLPVLQTISTTISTTVPGRRIESMGTFTGAILVFLNMCLYDGLGIYLVWIIKRHTAGHSIATPHEDPSNSTLKLVISRTFKSSAFLSVVCLAAFGLLINSGSSLLRNAPGQPYSATVAPSMGTLQMLFIQIAAEFMCTKLTWLSASQVLDRQKQANQSKPQSSLTAEGVPHSRQSRATTKSEMANRAKAQSQAATTTSASNSRDSRSEPPVGLDVPGLAERELSSSQYRLEPHVGLDVPCLPERELSSSQCRPQEVDLEMPPPPAEMTIVVDKPSSSSYNGLS